MGRLGRSGGVELAGSRNVSNNFELDVGITAKAVMPCG